MGTSLNGTAASFGHSTNNSSGGTENSFTMRGYEPKRFHWVVTVFTLLMTIYLPMRIDLLIDSFVVRQNSLVPLTRIRTLPRPTTSNWESTLQLETWSTNQITSSPYSTRPEARELLPLTFWSDPKQFRVFTPLSLLLPLPLLTFATMKIPTPVSTPKKSSGVGSLSADTQINGIALTATKNRSFELGAFADTVSPAYRSSLTGKTLFDFRNEAVVGLTPPFSFTWAVISVTDDKSFFEDNNKIMMQLYALKTRLTTYCMHSVFDILPVDETTGVLDSSGATLSLLDHACSISEAQVRLSNQIYAERITDSLHPQNLSWTQDLLLASCDGTLRADLENRLITIPDNEQGGPLVLHMILTQLMMTTTDAARGIVRRLEKHSVTTYPGENINQFCSTFNNVVLRLNMSGHVPADICSIFVERLLTCTVPKFRSMMDYLDNHDDPILQDFFGLRERVVAKYHSLLLSEKWLPTSKSDTPAFPALTETKKAAPVGTPKTNNRRPPLPIDTTPPGPGEANSKPHPTNPKRKLWWCALCPNGTPNGIGRWGNHSTDRHDPTKVNSGRSTPAATDAAAAHTTDSPPPSDSSDSPTSATESSTPPTYANIALTSLRDFH